VNNLLQKKR